MAAAVTATAQAGTPGLVGQVDDGASNADGVYRQVQPTEAVNPVCPDAAGAGQAGPGIVGKVYGGVTCPAPGADPNNAPWQGERPLTVGVVDSLGPGRALKANCTSAGSVSVLYADGSTGVWQVATGPTGVIGAAVVEVTGQTAACTYANLK